MGDPDAGDVDTENAGDVAESRGELTCDISGEGTSTR